MESHPVTGQLSSLLPTILGWRRPGKIGNANTEEDDRKVVLFLLFYENSGWERMAVTGVGVGACSRRLDVPEWTVGDAGPYGFCFEGSGWNPIP